MRGSRSGNAHREEGVNNIKDGRLKTARMGVKMASL